MARLPRMGATVAFWTLSLLIAVISLRFLFAPMQVVMAHMVHYLPEVPLALYAHIIGGPLALLLAPFQLWRGLRAARPRLHRAMGYAYVTAVVLAGAGSLLMLPHFLGSGFAAAGFAMLAVLWIGFTLRGVALARAGARVAHRRYMLRSVALTLAAVSLRLIMAPLMEQGWTVVETYQITGWGAWLPNLALMEIYIRIKSKRAPA